MKNKKVIRLSESQLHNIIAESVQVILKEKKDRTILRIKQEIADALNKVLDEYDEIGQGKLYPFMPSINSSGDLGGVSGSGYDPEIVVSLPNHQHWNVPKEDKELWEKSWKIFCKIMAQNGFEAEQFGLWEYPKAYPEYKKMSDKHWERYEKRRSDVNTLNPRTSEYEHYKAAKRIFPNRDDDFFHGGFYNFPKRK